MIVKGERAVGRGINQELGISVHAPCSAVLALGRLSCDPTDGSRQAPLSMGTLQVGVLQRAAMPSLNARYYV